MNDTDTTRPMTLHLHVIMAKFSVRHEKDGTLILTADLPGVRDSLKVTIQGRDLTVSTDEIERSFTVGYEYDIDKIEAKYEDGVLTVTIPAMPARVITFREQDKWTFVPIQSVANAAAAKTRVMIEYLIKNGILTKDKIEYLIKEEILSPGWLSSVPEAVAKTDADAKVETKVETKAPDQIEVGIMSPNPIKAAFEAPTLA